MSQLLLVSRKACEGKAWYPPQGAELAQTQAIIPLHMGELGKAASSMPLAARQHGQQWQLVGVCGRQEQRNLFVKGSEWLGHYRPDWLSSWPFTITTLRDKGYVAFARESGLLVEEEEDNFAAEPFFEDDGQMSAAVAARVELVKANHRRYLAASRALAALAAAGVLTPWGPLKQSLGLEVEGLHMVDEKALAALSDEAFLALRKAQALPLAYALNLSLSQTHLLARLERLNPASTKVSDSVDTFFGDGDEDDFVFDFGS